jgi:hypothetical protein
VNRISQDYQMQQMLLEQSNKKRLMMARQEVDQTFKSKASPDKLIEVVDISSEDESG